MEDLEQYRIPGNGLIGVTFVKSWNAYRAGQQAGFADQQAVQLRDGGLAVLRKYEEPAPRPPTTAGAYLGPIRGRASADPVNTANVRRAGEQGPAPEDPGKRIARTSGAGGPQGLGDFPETSGMGSTAQVSQGDFSRGPAEGGDDTGGSDDPRNAVEIPDDWKELHFQTKLKLARELGADDGVSTKDEAEGFITKELERRNAAQQ